MAAGSTSTLQVEVVSKGIAETTRKLDSLGYAAERNETKVRKLTDSLKNLMTAQNDAVSKAAQHSNLMSAIAQAMNVVANSAESTANHIKSLTNNLNSLTTSANATANALNNTARSGGVVNTTLRAMLTAASAYLSLNFAKSILDSADGWTMMRAKLKMATGSMEEAKAVQNDLFNLAQKVKAPLEDMGRLYNRISGPMERMGKDSKATMEQVEYLAASLKLSGTTAAEASSAMLQYSQSVNSGKLQGGEFNAIAEAAPQILQDITKYLKATGQMAEYGGLSLKEMASKGLITFDVLAGAAQMALPKVREQMNQIPETVDGALTRIKNAWFKAMGELGDDTELGKKFSQALGVFEDNIPKIRDMMVEAFNFLVNNFDKIKFALEAIIAIKFVGWIGECVGGIATMVKTFDLLAKGLGPVILGIKNATTAVAALELVATTLAGPWGVLIALVGTAAVAAYMHFSKEAPKADEAVTKSTAVHTASRISMLQKEIDKLNERNSAANVKPATAAEPMTSPEMDTALKKLLKAQKDYNEAKAAGNTHAMHMLEIDRNVAQQEYANAQAIQTQYLNTKKLNDEAKRTGELAALRTKVMTDHQTKQESITAELKKYEDEYAKFGEKLPDDLRKRIIEDMSPKGANPYETILRSVKATNGELKAQVDTTDKLTASQKLLAKLHEGGDDNYNKLPQSQKDEIDARVKANIALEEQIKANTEAKKAMEEAADMSNKLNKTMVDTTTQINSQVLAVRAQITALREGSAAAKEMTAAELDRKATLLEADAIKQMDPDRGGDETKLKLLLEQAQAYRDLAASQRELGAEQDSQAATAAMDKLLDPKKANHFGNALKSAFEAAGVELTKLTKALDEYGGREEAIAKAREEVMKQADGEKKTRELIALDKLEAKSKIRAAGDMAGAMKTLFKEHTAGYKVMSATEKTFRAIELAGTLKNNAEKLSGVWEFVSAKGAEIAASMTAAATDEALTGESVANSMIRATASLKAGVMKMYEMLGPWGTVGAAALLALAVSMGISGGGGSTPPEMTAEYQQKRQGTGTVLGDENAKSESISKSLDLLAANSGLALEHSSRMLATLRDIDQGISGMTAAVASTTGIKGTTADKYAAGVGSTKGALGFNSSSTEMTDAGLLFGNGTIGSMRNGNVNVQGYYNLHKEESSWWGLDSDSWDEQHLTQVNDALKKQVSLVIGGMADTAYEALDTLGKADQSTIDKINSMNVDLGKISLMGLTGEDIEKELGASFSKLGDQMASYVAPGFQAFQRAGEGSLQTAVRLANGVESAKNALANLNVAMIDYNDVQYKTAKDIGAQILRESIIRKEAGTNLAQFLKEVDGSVQDIVDTYKDLLDVRDSLKASGMGADVTRAMIAGAGSASDLVDAMSDYVSLLPETEQTAIKTAKLQQQFLRLGVIMPKSNAALADMIKSLMLGDAASQALAVNLMKLSSEFSDLQSTYEDMVSSARSDLSDAYERESSVLQDTKDKFLDFAKSLRDFNKSLLTGSSSPLTLAQKYAELTTQYENNLSLARTGDKDAIGKFQSIANELLTVSREYNASGAAYMADWSSVMNDSSYLATLAESQADVATQQLEALEKQVSGLIEVNTSVLTVAQAIENLHKAMAQAGYATPVDGSHANGLSNVPFDGYVAELHKGERVLTAAENKAYTMGNAPARYDDKMCKELQALRQEVSQLRKEQEAQTGALIGATYDSSERNADRIVEGTEDAVDKSSWKDGSKVKIV